MNKTKTLKMKLIYIVAAVAMLAMLIPAVAVPVSAADVYTVVLTVPSGAPDSGYDINGQNVIATLCDNGTPVAPGTASGWDVENNTAGANFVGFDPLNPPATVPSSVTVKNSGDGETTINAYIGGVKVASADKKWADIASTTLTDPGSSTVTWNQSTNAWYDQEAITDTVIGTFPTPHPAQGVILNWYLFDGNVTLPAAGMPNNEASGWMAALAGLQAADFVQFVDPTVSGFDPSNPLSPGWLGTGTVTPIQTVTDATGSSTVQIGAWGAENVQVVVIPEYPNNPQLAVPLEVTTWSFSISEMEIVPQVRWIGEKIVLEKNYTKALTGRLVNFTITSNSQDAILEPVGTEPAAIPIGENLVDNGRSYWTQVDEDGYASVILTDDNPEQVSVRAALYSEEEENMEAVSQTSFTVYFLKFETLTLSDVVGKRYSHDMGIWVGDDNVAMNPYNAQFPGADTADVLTQDRNVSQDALERAQVRGWFMGVNASTRPMQYLNTEMAPIEDNTLTEGDTITLPAGRWVLPDDWSTLAGGQTNWMTKRPHWDIMSAPNTIVVSPPTNVVTIPGTGPYLNSSQAYPIIGPFSPGIEEMTPTGWVINTITSMDPKRMIKTVVPDGSLNAWDAPMPPAKITFTITDGNGYFKWTDKSDIYQNALGEYTDPFYAELIPAHWAIPAFGDGSSTGYSWNSFDTTYGPYIFWTQIPLPSSQAVVPSSDWAGHPTAFEVYSDNHGEAMAYLNGNWNLSLTALGLIGGKDGADIMAGTSVGTTIVQATADYPYIREEPEISSNTVQKNWLWGGIVLGIDGHTYADGSTSAATLNIISAGNFAVTSGDPAGPTAMNGRGTSNDHTIFVWACDRDGLQAGAIGDKVDWTIVGGAWIQTYNSLNNKSAISQYNPITQAIYMNNNGFLDGTNGVVTNGTRTMGSSYMTAPTVAERQLFYKNWPSLYSDPTGNAPINFAVAAVDIYQIDSTSQTIQINISGTDLGYTGHPVGEVDYTANLLDGNIGVYPLDDPIIPGDVHNTGKVDATDITAIERIIMGLDSVDVNADVNSDGVVNMGDVVDVIRIIRGLPY